nr:MAG TPA: hypothetical protein [Caudoviricetes sp.]
MALPRCGRGRLQRRIRLCGCSAHCGHRAP